MSENLHKYVSVFTGMNALFFLFRARYQDLKKKAASKLKIKVVMQKEIFSFNSCIFWISMVSCSILILILNF